MEHEIVFGWPIVLYFFISGTAGGAFICATFLTLFSKESEKNKKLAFYEAVVSLGCLLVGAMLLFLDLGQPLRSWRLIAFPFLNPTSPIAWGTVILMAHFTMLVSYIYYMFIDDQVSAKKVSVIGIFIATCLVSYTGALLSSCPAFPLWHSAILVPLFFASGCISGLSLLFLIGFAFKVLSPEDEIFDPLRKILLWLIIVDGAILTDYYILYAVFIKGLESARMILFGQLAFLFWGGEVILGILLPITIILSSYGRTEKGLALTSVLAMVGVFAMRYLIVVGGQI